MSANDNHPELLEGEMFVTNTANPEMTGVYWNTKRLGKVAYDIKGVMVQGLYPVFRLKSEGFTEYDTKALMELDNG